MQAKYRAFLFQAHPCAGNYAKRSSECKSCAFSDVCKPLTFERLIKFAQANTIEEAVASATPVARVAWTNDHSTMTVSWDTECGVEVCGVVVKCGSQATYDPDLGYVCEGCCPPPKS